MSQLWALIAADGSFVLRYTDGPEMHPRDHGHREECADKAIWPIAREPDIAVGERIDRDGTIAFSAEAVTETLLAEIRAEARRRIIAISPDWRQRNDLRQPSPEGRERFAAIDRIRDRSNRLEAAARKVRSTADVGSIRQAIEESSTW